MGKGWPQVLHKKVNCSDVFWGMMVPAVAVSGAGQGWQGASCRLAWMIYGVPLKWLLVFGRSKQTLSP